jgi:hypothetical protein
MGVYLMRRRRELHRAPRLVEAEIADGLRHPRPRRLGLEGGRRNAPDSDRRGRRARDRAADRGAPRCLILGGQCRRKSVAKCHRVRKQRDRRLGPAQVTEVVRIGVEIEHRLGVAGGQSVEFDERLVENRRSRGAFVPAVVLNLEAARRGLLA